MDRVQEVKVNKKYVEEAPYHPGYEDAVVDQYVKSWIEEYLEYRNRHLNTANKIIEFMKGGQKWER